MKKIFTISSFLLPLLLSQNANAQYYIPGDYATVADAVTDLNTYGPGGSGVIFYVLAGHTETTNIPAITATGSAGNTIVFQKEGAGANPKITPLSPGIAPSS